MVPERSRYQPQELRVVDPHFAQRVGDLRFNLAVPAMFSVDAPRMSLERYRAVGHFSDLVRKMTNTFGKEKDFPLTEDPNGIQTRDRTTFRRKMATKFKDLSVGPLTIPLEQQGSLVVIEVGNGYHPDPENPHFRNGQAVLIRFPGTEDPITIAKVDGDLCALPVGGKQRLTNVSIHALNAVLDSVYGGLETSDLPRRSDSTTRFPIFLE